MEFGSQRLHAVAHGNESDARDVTSATHATTLSIHPWHAPHFDATNREVEK